MRYFALMNWKQLLSLDLEKRLPLNSNRTFSERDYDRIIFSSPFRRLQDKTQVFPLPNKNFVHSRLTHSLEVASVGRSLGKKAGEVLIQRHPALEKEVSPADFGGVVAAAALAHDIGNPPFGHSGESAISDFFQRDPLGQLLVSSLDFWEQSDLLNFEGNAQGFRLLTNDWYQGLKVSDACLAAFTKYPRPSNVEKITGRKSQAKFGFFRSEAMAFERLANRLGLIKLSEGSFCRHPLAYLVEAADDICYHLIDLEDGSRMGLVSHSDSIALYAGILGDKFIPAKLNRIKSKEEQIAVLRAVAIGVLIDQVLELFLDRENGILEGKHDSAIVDHIPSKDDLAEIVSVSIKQIYRSTENLGLEAAGFEILGGLLSKFCGAAYSLFIEKSGAQRDKVIYRFLPETTRALIEEANDELYAILRITLDYISSLTDSEAIRIFQRLKGMA